MSCWARAVLAVALLGGCGPVKPADPSPGPLRVGVATLPLDAPVGLPMGGYSRGPLLNAPGEPGSAWAQTFPATRGLQTLPTARAIAVSNGVTTFVVVRIDTALTTPSLRWRAQWTLRELGSDAPLLVEATHTHAGPARFFPPAPVDGVSQFDPTASSLDTYDAEAEARLGRSMALAAKAALDGMVSASMGVHAVADFRFNNDRRCENDDLYGPGYQDRTLTVVRFDAVDGSGSPTRPLAGFLHYAMHGTILDDDNSLFSTDAPGAMETWASDAVGVPLLYLQGAAGDVSPSTGARGHTEFQAMERLGRMAAPGIAQAFADAKPGPAPTAATVQWYEVTPLTTRESLGYARGEFPEFGGIGCGLGAEGCAPPKEIAPKDLVCLPLKRRAYNVTDVVVGRIGGFLFASMPGEPTTAIAERAKEQLSRVEGVTHRVVVGYAQDHAGYILERPDYLRLGYEPYVSPWGYRFGEFVVKVIGEAVDKLGQKPPPLVEPARVEVTSRRAAVPSAVEPREEGAVGPLARLETARFRFHGGDPALGTPQVWLERQEGGGFAPVPASPVRTAGLGLEVVLRYVPAPTFREAPDAGGRDHLWVAEWETLPTTPVGRYWLVAKGTASVQGAERAFELPSAAFDVAASSAVVRLEAQSLGGGKLGLVALFPPNPTVRDGGVVVAGVRLRDPFMDPNKGAQAEGGSITAQVTPTGGAAQTVSFLWDASARLHVATVPGAGPMTSVAVAASGVTDGAGNTNATPLSATVPPN